VSDESGVTDASMLVVGPKKRGRPPAQRECTSLSMWIPTDYYDRLTQIARRNGVSMSAVARQLIILQLHRK
jgi:hypothetical protein